MADTPSVTTIMQENQTYSAWGMGIQGAGQAVISFLSFLTGKVMLEMQKDALTHKTEMAKDAMEMETGRLKAQDKLVADVGSLQEPAQAAAQEKATAEGEQAQVKERIHQQELSKSASRRSNQQTLNRLLYRYGEPVQPR
ncbi:MAG: hypothetical protein HY465_01305 [Deltaproteobacteria bacterium]|nr:hypothetical protein [Deltaproteobacteria bacterium]